MGFRFRRTIKILPGVKVNISKSGFSTSIGGPGATVNIKRGRKTKTTLGVPGTGISHTSYSGEGASRARQSKTENVRDCDQPQTNWRDVIVGIGFLVLIGVIAKACS
ncbi:DUF4236 domain-containing protein [Pseudoduganella sp. FT26W]|uniref:DUF4236 domain-containing protein n=1 Tax=Duganella aquatilis TaxID=2666082 RepID=A0A844CQD5_9BURK|nr:DUF4236 domain-containing protein [Duganella aquatilis]